MKIGIAISIHNRHESAKICVKNWKKFLPKGAILVIVDDGSSIPFPGADFRFEKAQGISVAKNKCLQLLTDAGCTDIFLSDDDCFPKAADWWQPYVNSPEPHLMFTFSELKDGRPNGNRIAVNTGELIEYANPCGCLLYVHKSALDKVGGFDPRFLIYSHEHAEWSNRIHNAGMTTYKFQDVPNSLELFYSMDWAMETLSSVQDNRALYIATNYNHLTRVRDSKEFIPFKPVPGHVATCAITNLVDPQYGVKRDSVDTSLWEQSVQAVSGVVPVVLRDANESPHTNPYFARWFYYRDYVASLDHICYVWLTDGTDVTMLRNPFHHMKWGVLYVGNEVGSNLTHPWLRNHHAHDFYNEMFDTPLPLLNAGICGGNRDTVLEFCNIMCERSGLENQLTDMAMFNYTAYIEFKGRFEHGVHVNTVFKGYSDNGVAWFMHK